MLSQYSRLASTPLDGGIMREIQAEADVELDVHPWQHGSVAGTRARRADAAAVAARREMNNAGLRAGQAGQTAQQRRFATIAAAEQANNFARVVVQCDVIDSPNFLQRTKTFR
jgi:hypothetical protein